MNTETKVQDITLTMPLDTINFILATLDRNPLGVSVMQVANLINGLRAQVEARVKAQPAPVDSIGS